MRFSVHTGQFCSPVSSREFSISVLRRQRLGSNSHETGSILEYSKISVPRVTPHSVPTLVDRVCESSARGEAPIQGRFRNAWCKRIKLDVSGGRPTLMPSEACRPSEFAH